MSLYTGGVLCNMGSELDAGPIHADSYSDLRELARDNLSTDFGWENALYGRRAPGGCHHRTLSHPKQD